MPRQTNYHNSQPTHQSLILSFFVRSLAGLGNPLTHEPKGLTQSAYPTFTKALKSMMKVCLMNVGNKPVKEEKEKGRTSAKDMVRQLSQRGNSYAVTVTYSHKLQAKELLY